MRADEAVAQAAGALKEAKEHLLKVTRSLSRGVADLSAISVRLARYAGTEKNPHAAALASLAQDPQFATLSGLPVLDFQSMCGGTGANNVMKIKLASETLVAAIGRGDKFKNAAAEVVDVSARLSETLYKQAVTLERFIDRIDAEPGLRRSLQKQHGAQVVEALRTLWADLASFLCELRNEDGPCQKLVDFARAAKDDPESAMAVLNSQAVQPPAPRAE